MPAVAQSPQRRSIEVTSWPPPRADGESTFWDKELTNNSAKCVPTRALKKNARLRQHAWCSAKCGLPLGEAIIFRIP